MLLAIRERVMGVVGWVILGLLIITFVFFGLNSYLTGDVKSYAAVVNGEEISQSQHQRAYEQLRARMEEMLGKNIDQAGLDINLLKANALQQLVNESLVVHAADTDGYTASNQLVAARINAIDAFKIEGVFSKEKYERVLGFGGFPPGQFEYNLKREIVADQLRSGIVRTAAVAEKSLSQAFVLEGQQRDFRYLLLPLNDYKIRVTVTEQEVKDYYDSHNELFMSEEQARIQYLELDAADIQSEVEIDDQDLQALYEEQYDNYVTSEKRHARHILINSSGDADDATSAAAFEKATGAIKRLEAGEPFDVLAKELSEDPGSARLGGDLGFFERGAMVAEFEQAVFKLKVGERSGVIKTPFGYHIIKLVEIKAETVTPFAEVRDSLVDQLLSVDRSDLFYEKSEDLYSLAFEQPDTLQAAADAVGLEIKESGWIGRNSGAGIAANANVLESVFSDDVLINRNNSAALEIGSDHVVILRVVEHQQAALEPFEKVAEQAREQVLADKSRQLISDKGNELLVSLRQGSATLESIAKAESLPLEQTGFIQRDAQTPERAIVSKAFTLRQSAAGQTVYGSLSLGLGDYVIVALDKIKGGDFSGLQVEYRQKLRRSLTKVRGAAELAVILSILKEQASIDIPTQSAE